MKKIKSIILIVLAAFALVPICSVFGLDVRELTLHDETIYSRVTINDNFSPSHVWVILTRDASRNFEQFDISDFPEIDILDVQCHTVGVDKAKVQHTAQLSSRCNSMYYDVNQAINLNEFRRVLLLTLAEPSKENVILAIQRLQVREDVMKVEPEFISNTTTKSNDYGDFSPLSMAGSDWWMNTIRLHQARQISGYGNSTIHVGIVDTGVDRNHVSLTHNMCAILSRDFTGANNPWGDWDHGTPVASIVAGQNGIGVAPNIRMSSLRVNAENMYVMTPMVISAIQHAVNNPQIRILNMSLVINQFAILVNIGIASNILVVAAAGNCGHNISVHPNYQAIRFNKSNNLMLVGATCQNVRRRSESNFGLDHVDIFAPGTYIRSALPFTGWRTGAFDRTSAASPIVAGLAALILSVDPTLNPNQVSLIIRRNANQNVSACIHNHSRARGIVDAYAAIRYVFLNKVV